MLCDKCNYNAPDDSDFCPNCGNKISNPLPQPPADHAQTKHPEHKKTKVRYCSRCGALIDADTKKCTGCGRYYFKGIGFNKFSLSVFILTLVLVGSIATNIYLFVQVRDMQTKIAAQGDHCANLQKELDDFEKSYTYAVNSIELLQKRIDALEAETNRSDMTYSEWKEKHANDNNP